MKTNETYIFHVSQGRVLDGDRILLDGIDLAIPPGRITVVLGPGGVGKSTLLKTLTGSTPPSWSIEGDWSIATGEEDGNNGSRTGLLWVPQVVRGSSTPALRSNAESELLQALRRAPRAVVLDEPSRPADENRESWIHELKNACRHGSSALVVTHDLGLAAELADDVVLVYQGRIADAGEASGFFRDPPSELARKFLKHGNCSPPASRPDLPSHFRWIEEGRLAGMGRPGLLGDVDHDLEAIAAAGIENLVTLTEDPLSLDALRAVGIESLHFPIADMGVPSYSSAARVAGRITRWIDAGSPVAVHCHAGLGRTGLVLAVVRIWKGSTAARALDELRAICPSHVQSRAQELFLESFAEQFGPRVPAPTAS